MQTQKIIIANPRGFCAGVDRAIKIVEQALEKYGPPIYVNHEIVHNRFVVENFEKKKVVFTDDLETIPPDSIYIFSAHGVSPLFRKKVEAKNLKIIDATCPLVTKVHWEAEKFSREGFEIIYIGQKNHQEYKGVAGVCDLLLIENLADIEKKLSPRKIEQKFSSKKTVCLTQTTLSDNDTKILIEKIKEKIPDLKIPGDICYATTNRQEAVEALAQKTNFVLIFGSPNSSNSTKLVSTAKKVGTPSQLFESLEKIPRNIFEYQTLRISSGASVPEFLIENFLDFVKQKNPAIKIEYLSLREENLNFPLPKI